MSATLDEITQLLASPQKPIGLSRSWSDVENDLGLTLPSDYKSFIDIYGTGSITSDEGWIDVWNFRDTSLFHPSIRDELGSVMGVYRSLESTDFPCPFPLYPSSPGILPFGSVVDVHHLNWLTEGDHAQWGVVYFFSDGLEFERLDNDSFSRCILKMLEGDYQGLSKPSCLEGPVKFSQATNDET